MIPIIIPNTRKFIGTVRIYVIYDNEYCMHSSNVYLIIDRDNTIT